MCNMLAAYPSMVSYNRGQKSWDKFALLVLLGTRQTRLQLPLPNLAPHPPYNVENYYLQFLMIFNIVLGGEGKEQRVFKRKASLLSNFSSKTRIILPPLPFPPPLLSIFLSSSLFQFSPCLISSHHCSSHPLSLHFSFLFSPFLFPCNGKANFECDARMIFKH